MTTPRLRPIVLAVAAALLAGLGATTALAAEPFPHQIDLPDGFAPEGITAGTGTTAYAGSLAGGAIVAIDVRTGAVDELVAPAGTVAVGMDYEDSAHRLWVAGGPTGQVRVYDASTGALLRTYQLPAGTHGFLNDVVVTDDAVYVTDSNVQQVAVIPLGDGSAVPPADAITTLPLTGDLVFGPGFNANGIVARGPWLILVQSTTGLLFRVDPTTGTTRTIDADASASFGDGLELRGSTLYVVRNFLGEVAVFRLGAGLASATLVDSITATGSDVPTTIAAIAGRLWAVNARFTTPVTPATEYWVTQVPTRS